MLSKWDFQTGGGDRGGDGCWLCCDDSAVTLLHNSNIWKWFYCKEPPNLVPHLQRKPGLMFSITTGFPTIASAVFKQTKTEIQTQVFGRESFFQIILSSFISFCCLLISPLFLLLLYITSNESVVNSLHCQGIFSFRPTCNKDICKMKSIRWHQTSSQRENSNLTDLFFFFRLLLGSYILCREEKLDSWRARNRTSHMQETQV